MIKKSSPSKHLLIVAALLIISCIILVFVRRHHAKETFSDQKEPLPSNACGKDAVHKCRSASADATLLPVNDHIHNLKEIVKQMILLEDHLFQKEKQCIACIANHMYAIEAFAEEGITLDTGAQHCELFNIVVQKIRVMQSTWRQDPTTAAQDVRELRRSVMDALI